MKFKYFLLFNLINLSLCFSKFDDDDYLNEFNPFPEPHLDIQRNKIKLPASNFNDHSKLNSESFNFSNEDFKYDPFRGDKFNKNEQFKEDKYSNNKNDPFKDVKANHFKDDYYFMKNDRFKDDEFKNDDHFKLNNNHHQIIKTELPKTDNFKTKIILKKKEPKQHDTFNKSDSFVNEFNTDFDLNRIPDLDFNVHDSWFDQNRDFDIPRHDRIAVDEKLVHDYRQPTPRTPFRVPMIPVPAFYPHPFPVPTPFIPTFPVNRPQQPQPQQQQQNRPQRPNNQQQQNSVQNQPGVFYPFYPVVMPHSIPNSQSNSQSSNSQNNVNQQIQHALSNMMNRNSFLGFVDPLIIVAIIAIPVIAMLGFSSVIMPFIPVIIYILNIFFPVSAAGRRKRRKRSTIDFDKFCLLFNLMEKNNLKENNLDNVKNIPIFYLSKFNELEFEILRRLHRSICMFNN